MISGRSHGASAGGARDRRDTDDKGTAEERGELDRLISRHRPVVEGGNPFRIETAGAELSELAHRINWRQPEFHEWLYAWLAAQRGGFTDDAKAERLLGDGDRALEKGKTEHLKAVNPWDAIRARALDTMHRDDFKAEDARRIIDRARSSIHPWMETLFLVGFCTGQRLGDCALLKWESVFLDAGYARIVPRKNARRKNPKVVDLPLHPELAAHLARLARGRGSDAHVPARCSGLVTRPCCR